MGALLPATLFFLLHLKTLPQLFTVAAATFMSWGVAEVLAGILEKPRLKGRTATAAWREDIERRAEDV
jgi:hypothetical protein